MSRLPPGWIEATIGDLVRFNYGKGLPERERTGQGYPVFGSNGVVGYHSHMLITNESLIVGRKGSVGEVHYAQGPCWPIDTTYFVDEFSGMPARYWYFALKSLDLGGLNRSTAIPGLNREDAYKVHWNLAPLPEQKRIADKIDAVLARVDACRDRLDRVPGILKRFRQSVLTAATSGKLTEDWRAEQVARMQPQAESGNVARDAAELCYHVISPLKRATASDEVIQRLEERRHSTPSTRKFKEPVAPDMTQWKTDIPDGWSVESISAYADCLDYMRVPVTKGNRASTQGLYPYYGANGQVDSVDEFLFDDELVLVTEDETFYGREKPIAYRTSGRCWVNNHAHVLLAGNAPRADYLCFALMYYDVLPWLTGTTGRAKLTQGVLNALPIAVPPQIEIEEIVRRVETLFANADRLEARYQTARAQVEKLTPALLAKAFRGELVPQDPDDEPASSLLARITVLSQQETRKKSVLKGVG